MKPHVKKWLDENLKHYDFIRISENMIETVSTFNRIDGNGNLQPYCNYDFRSVMPDCSIILSGVSSGYYWQQSSKRGMTKNVGVRKLYSSNKGLYFTENGKREYLNNFKRIYPDIVKGWSID